ncbi:hypothetical protein EDD11_008763 [Mortierella claussenii]|nr:hypothetical protein EDD11_008763 [Mortierella claussenii]
MAKRKTAARKTTRHVAGGESHPYRAGSASKHVSASPSVASSPSPQPQDLVQLRRRKGTPVRSPSHGDTSKGIVFAFRIKKDADLSMAVDILSYDQVPEEGSLPLVTTAAAEAANSTVSTTAASIASGPASTTAAAAPIQLRVAGKQWSSDPSSFPSNNVMDLTRNMLILHSRKPQDPSTPSSMSLSPSPSSLQVIIHVILKFKFTAIDTGTQRFRVTLVVTLELSKLTQHTS